MHRRKIGVKLQLLIAVNKLRSPLASSLAYVDASFTFNPANTAGYVSYARFRIIIHMEISQAKYRGIILKRVAKISRERDPSDIQALLTMPRELIRSRMEPIID